MMIKSSIPEGKMGHWAVEKFTIFEEEAQISALRALAHNGRGLIMPGDYTRLTYKGNTIMSDSPDEMGDQRSAINQARGYVLVTGLGLGLTVEGMLDAERYSPLYREGHPRMRHPVEHLTVLEISPEVIQLVGPTLREKYSDRLEIVNVNAFDWDPGNSTFQPCFDYIWHDIWPDIRAANLIGIRRLKRKYKRYLAIRGKQVCWLEDECRQLNRRRL